MKKVLGESFVLSSFFRGLDSSVILYLLRESKMVHFVPGEFVYGTDQPPTSSTSSALTQCGSFSVDGSTASPPGISASRPTSLEDILAIWKYLIIARGCSVSGQRSTAP